MNAVLLVETVSPAEMRVLDQVALGKSNQQIAVALYLSERTVRGHMSNILAKLDVTTRLEAVLSAQELGLVESPDTISAAATLILVLLKSYPSALDELVEAGAMDRLKGTYRAQSGGGEYGCRDR